MINWKLERKSIKDLQKFQKNPRTLSKDQFRQLKTSLDKFGLIDKPIINLDNTIIGGHQRLEVLKKSGAKDVECWVPDKGLSSHDIEELNVRLNKNVGDWDFDVLANEFEITDLLEWGFDPEELMGACAEEIEAEEKEDSKKKKQECPNCGFEF
jgi:ParB-like chromosome segregation protein Spo0J